MDLFDHIDTPGGKTIKAWIRDVPVEPAALEQLRNIARLSVVEGVAAMPDVHFGIGATVGSVIATKRAVIPAAVGVDIGCGMCAMRTSLEAKDLPDDLAPMRDAIERAVPHGRSKRGRDRGAWDSIPNRVGNTWKALSSTFEEICDKHPKIRQSNNLVHLGTLGTGNHFVEVCLDEADRVWFMLHSGSRGVGNRIGRYFIELAKKDMRRHIQNLPDQNLAYFEEGAEHFDDYVQAVEWAQGYARQNRELMMHAVIGAVRRLPGIRPFQTDKVAVNCHHNYVARETHYGHPVFVTRKGAVRAGLDELGIIPGSMGARSFIVRGRGNPHSFESCSHGAGRIMSRTEAKRRFTVEDHAAATAGVECRKDVGVIDETPMAYKPIDKVMAAQSDLVDIEHTLRQVVCVKG